MNSTIRRTVMVFIVAATLLTLYLIFNSVTDRLTVAEQTTERNNQALTQANGKVTALGQQVRGLGESPVVSTTPIRKPKVERGAQGAQGVAGIAGIPGATGPQGAPGADAIGRTGRTGKDGATITGSTGAAGSDGAAGEQGATGSNGSDGTNGKDGSDGSDGKDGAAGADGRGIASVTCAGPGAFTFTITYTDGSTAEVACAP